MCEGGGGVAKVFAAVALVAGTTFDAVVGVDVGGGSEALVVEGERTGGFLELFGEGVDGAEVIGGGGDLEAGGFEELLVAAVEDARDLAVEEPSGAGEDFDLAIGRSRNLGSAAVFRDFEGVWRALCTLDSRGHIKPL